MGQEIFGPVLPIFRYNDLDVAINHINSGEKPLVAHVFTSKSKVRDRVLTETSSGGACVNDAILHLSNDALPFGGVGNSGMGRYHGKYTFDMFTHEKSVLIKYFKTPNASSLLKLSSAFFVRKILQNSSNILALEIFPSK